MPACMSEDGNPAVFVGTMLQTGDSVALCDNCLANWAVAVVSTMTGIDPAPFIAAISEDAPTTAEGAPTDEPPPPAPADPDPEARAPDPANGPMSNGSAGPGTAKDPPAPAKRTKARSSQPAS